MNEGQDSRQRRRLSPWQVVKSILAAALGVQSEEARERDFSKGSPAPFIIGGIIFTVVFVLVLVLIVQMVVSSAGG
ncbi:DUF2970 domain-containing protein [Ectothiorhodospiraceae bacterium WFHF3C12]|nr:DUF2970 domain-containing protein [Ectothiorhodospiraceae bacterium WFHF3C12]